jgi:outer membrane cobalamin receptor
LKRRLPFTFLLLLLFSKGFSQPEDSLKTVAADSLSAAVKTDSLETVCVVNTGRSAERDYFYDELLRSFSLWSRIVSKDIDDLIGESVGDILSMSSLMNLTEVGPQGQPEVAVIGGNLRGVSIFVDGRPVQRQDLNIPQVGHLDLNSVLLSSTSEVQLLPGGVAALWGKDVGILGVNIVTKDFHASEPYSRATAIRGPFGFSRTQVELGRGITSRGRFYLTAELKKSDGYLQNADYDGLSFSGNTTFKLKRWTYVRLSAYRYKADMGLAHLQMATFKDTRKKLDNWGTGSTLLFRENLHTHWELGLRYQRQNQESKSAAYGFESKKLEEAIDIRVSRTQGRGRSRVRIEGYAERKNLLTLGRGRTARRGYISLADIYWLRPEMALLLFGRLEREEGLETGLAAGAGISYSPVKRVRIFSTLGRHVGYPTLMDRFWPPFSVAFRDTVMDYVEEGNGGLKAQECLTADIGARFKKGHCQISAYLFGSRINDFILWSNIDTSLYFGHFQPVNSEAEIWGANLDLRLEFFDHVRSYVSYSFKKGKDSDRRLRLPFSPEHSLFAYLQLEDELLKKEIGVRLRLETKVLSERFMDEYEQDREPGVAILNGKITVRFLDFHFYYMVRNITDQVYRSMGDYHMPGRSFWWGFCWEFFN